MVGRDLRGQARFCGAPGGYGVACSGQAARGGLAAWLGCVDGGICRRGQGGAAVVTEAVRGHRPAVVSSRADDGGSPEDGRAGEGYPSLLLAILALWACVNCIVMMLPCPFCFAEKLGFSSWLKQAFMKGRRSLRSGKRCCPRLVR